MTNVLASKLVAFDVDGTLEVSAGPIPLDALNQLRRQGTIVYIVGNYGKLAQTTKEFADGNIGRSKAESLKLLAERHPNTVKIYVADTSQDETEAKTANWQFIYARDFKLGDY